VCFTPTWHNVINCTSGASRKTRFYRICDRCPSCTGIWHWLFACASWATKQRFARCRNFFEGTLGIIFKSSVESASNSGFNALLYMQWLTCLVSVFRWHQLTNGVYLVQSTQPLVRGIWRMKAFSPTTMKSWGAPWGRFLFSFCSENSFLHYTHKRFVGLQNLGWLYLAFKTKLFYCYHKQPFSWWILKVFAKGYFLDCNRSMLKLRPIMCSVSALGVFWEGSKCDLYQI